MKREVLLLKEEDLRFQQFLQNNNNNNNPHTHQKNRQQN